jgi:hypothetical protein
VARRRHRRDPRRVELRVRPGADDLVDIVATSDPLTGKTAAAGIADADDVTFIALTGDTATAVILAHDTGSTATSRLIAYYDTRDDSSPVNIVPDGSDYLLEWSNLDTRIFRL